MNGLVLLLLIGISLVAYGIYKEQKKKKLEKIIAKKIKKSQDTKNITSELIDHAFDSISWFSRRCLRKLIYLPIIIPAILIAWGPFITVAESVQNATLDASINTTSITEVFGLTDIATFVPFLVVIFAGFTVIGVFSRV